MGLRDQRQLTLYDGRHHWAATRVRAGVPIEVVSHQLGQPSTEETLRVYGKFRSSGVDRRAAEESVYAYEAKRRRALAKLMSAEDPVPAGAPRITRIDPQRVDFSYTISEF